MNTLNEFHARANKLVSTQRDIEKCRQLILEKLQKAGGVNICELSDNLEKQRSTEKYHLEDIVNSITTEVKAKTELILEDAFQIKDYKKFKSDMINLQENIRKLQYDIKFHEKIEEKQNEELREDIEYYTNKLSEWSQPIKLSSTTPTTHLSLNLKQTFKKHACKEVDRFLHFIHVSGGYENGWRKEDHHLFLKLYLKNQNIEEIAEKLHEILPDISKEEIVRHAEWYEKFLTLKEKRKEAIHNWQNNKICKTSSDINNVETKLVFKPVAVTELNIQDKLCKWKAEKECKLLDLIMQEKLKEEKQRQLDEMKKKQQDEMKQIVQEWKCSKAEVERRAKLEKQISEENERRKRAAVANKMIKSFQSQDDIYIMKMKKNLQKTPEQIPVRSKSSSMAKRDPNRLLKPTQQWIHRVHDEHLLSNKPGAYPLACIPKLRIPEWRK